MTESDEVETPPLAAEPAEAWAARVHRPTVPPTAGKPGPATHKAGKQPGTPGVGQTPSLPGARDDPALSRGLAVRIERDW